MTAVDVDTRADAKAGFSTNCRAGNHSTCQTIGARCTCTCHGKAHVCEDCGRTFSNAAGLGGHRSIHRSESDNPIRRASSTATKVKVPARPVLIELVDEDPPPPPAPKLKPIEEILALVEGADLQPGKWWRVALFLSSRAAKAAATRLSKLTDGGPYEWLATGDDRLFVRVRPADD